MNQEPNNNVENIQTVVDNTQQINLDNTQTNIDSTQQVSLQQTQEVTVQPPTTTENTQAVQPAIQPTVTVDTPVETKVEVDTKPHDVPIPDESDKKDFVIKSKKETVAEETKKREAKIEEHVRQANENYKPNSKFTVVLLVVFLVFIILFTWFLPEIHNYITKWQSGELKPKEEAKITNGTLNCTFDKSSDTLDYSYVYDFQFSKNTLISYKKEITTKGDSTLDRDTLDKLKTDCSLMKNESENIDGITVSCDNQSNSITVIEKLDLSDYKNDSITAAFTEAGGDYPEYSYEQNMDDIEKTMKAAGFTCERKGK